MSESDYKALKATIEQYWSHPAGEKTRGYVGQFFNTTRLGTRVSGEVVGNHGTYRVTVDATPEGLTSACSCYIGKHGGCHHCHALGLTFIQNPAIFTVLKTRSLEMVASPDEVVEFLRGVTLDDLIGQLRAIDITQKAFAESMGMSSQHLSAVKSSERRNRYFHELGAIKVACLWYLERFGKD